VLQVSRRNEDSNAAVWKQVVKEQRSTTRQLCSQTFISCKNNSHYRLTLLKCKYFTANTWYEQFVTFTTTWIALGSHQFKAGNGALRSKTTQSRLERSGGPVPHPTTQLHKVATSLDGQTWYFNNLHFQNSATYQKKNNVWRYAFYVHISHLMTRCLRKKIIKPFHVTTVQLQAGSTKQLDKHLFSTNSTHTPRRDRPTKSLAWASETGAPPSNSEDILLSYTNFHKSEFCCSSHHKMPLSVPPASHTQHTFPLLQ
jgi:hypothetical protein